MKKREKTDDAGQVSGRPLAGIKILDLTWALAGPFATMMLCDLGADIIKIERPGIGDRARENWPIIDGVSVYYFSLNRGKKSIVIDLRKEKGKQLFIELVKTVDVVVENFTPGTMDEWGVGFGELKKHNRRILYAALSGFGQDGPYAHKPALDVIAQGMGGAMSMTGPEDGPPVRIGPSVGDIVGGMFLAFAILAALRERDKSGQGQMIDLSLLDCQVALLENAFARYFATGEISQRWGSGHPFLYPFNAYETKDGWIVITATGPIEQWALFLQKLGRLDVLSDARFHDRGGRFRYRKELDPIISQALKTRTTREWVQEFESIGMPCGPVNNIAEAAADPQLIFRKAFVDLPASTKKGSMKVANTPIKFSRTPIELAKGAPDLGQDTEAVLLALPGMTRDTLEELKREGVVQTGPAPRS